MQPQSYKLAVADSSQTANYCRLVSDIYCSRLGWTSKTGSKKLFPENLWEFGHVVVVQADQEVAAGMYLVKSQEQGFPHEKIFGNFGKYLSRHPQHQRTSLREITRLATRPGHQQKLLPHCIKALYWFGKLHRLSGYCMAIDMKVFLYCYRLSVPLTPIALCRFCEGSWVVPAVLDFKKMALVLAKRNPALWRYITDKTNLEETLSC